MKFGQPILVTRPFLPDRTSIKEGLDRIWSSGWLTNKGPELIRFTEQIAEFLNEKKENVSLFCNGTSALQIGIESMVPSGGEIITTPFTFVATAHAIVRSGNIPVFADIDPETFCLSPESAERLISEKTRAIVPVHVYGHPCEVEAFDRIGKKYGIKIIYDAAHAIGVKVGGVPITKFGDVSMVSLHSTKVVHSVEGGFLVFKDACAGKLIERMKNFSIISETEADGVGTNAKMSEIHAMIGSECLMHADEIIAKRKRIHAAYRLAFDGFERAKLIDPDTFGISSVMSYVPNYAYCPILFRNSEDRDLVYEGLKRENVFARRYFYPLVTSFRPYSEMMYDCPVAKSVCERILTLPTYYDLSEEDAVTIARTVMEILS